MMTAGIYIHVPFCQSKCPYCDFYSGPADEAEKNAYLGAVMRAISLFEGSLSADTLYFGGGTPSVFGVSRLLEVLNGVKGRFDIAKNAEITLEANPNSVTPAMLNELCQGGFNRISFGVQSTHADMLKLLGRTHSFECASNAILEAKQAGFARISADLMLGIPGQALQQIDRDIAALSSLPIDHLSAYLLSVEPNTYFGKANMKTDDDFQADCYEQLIASAHHAGWHQYEISSWCKAKEAKSRHNLKYWHCLPYLGIGPAAHSMIGERRFFFPRDTKSFIAAENPWDLAVYEGEGGGDAEKVMLGLRLDEGVDLGQFAAGERMFANARELSSLGLVIIEGSRARLTPKGFLLSNSIISKIIYD